MLYLVSPPGLPSRGALTISQKSLEQAQTLYLGLFFLIVRSTIRVWKQNRSDMGHHNWQHFTDGSKEQQKVLKINSFAHYNIYSNSFENTGICTTPLHPTAPVLSATLCLAFGAIFCLRDSPVPESGSGMAVILTVVVTTLLSLVTSVEPGNTTHSSAIWGGGWVEKHSFQNHAAVQSSYSEARWLRTRKK